MNLRFRLLLIAGLGLGSLLLFWGCQKTEAELEQAQSTSDNHPEDLFTTLSPDLKVFLQENLRNAEGVPASAFLESEKNIPTLRAGLSYYKIQMRGNTFNGYYPFVRSACFILSPTIRAAGGVNFNNGVNHADIGLFSGSPLVGQAGAIWFTSNTAMCRYGNTGCSTAASALDLVTTAWDPQKRILTIRPDGRFFGNAAAGNALVGMLNIFNAKTSVAAQIYRIIGGSMSIQFSADFRSVAGVINITGTSFYGGSTGTPYTVQFSGTLTSYCNQ